jgi:hypothetical protein
MAVVERLNDGPSTFSPVATYLEPLFDGDTPFSEMAQLAVAVALLAKDAGTRGLAVDALILLGEDGPCTGHELGAIFGKLVKKKGMVRLNRLTESLADVQRASMLHERMALRVLKGALASLRSPLPSDLHHLLTALRELLIKTGEPLSLECRPILEAVAGTGKTARLANLLLELQSDPPERDRHRSASFNVALRGRMKRAQVWSTRSSSP